MLCRHTSIFRAGHLRSSADLVGLPHAVSRRVWTLEIRSSIRRAAYGALDVACILGPFSALLERFPVHWDGFFVSLPPLFCTSNTTKPGLPVAAESTVDRSVSGRILSRGYHGVQRTSGNWNARERKATLGGKIDPRDVGRSPSFDNACTTRSVFPPTEPQTKG